MLHGIAVQQGDQDDGDGEHALDGVEELFRIVLGLMQVGDGLGDQGFDKARPKAGQDHTRKEEGIVPRQGRHDEADGDTETRQDEQGLGADHPQKLDRDDEDKEDGVASESLDTSCSRIVDAEFLDNLRQQRPCDDGTDGMEEKQNHQ